jgi:catechol 2,3-dioxygenase-like lactoylglutathione lyase family enzyme
MPQITQSHRTDKPLVEAALLSHGTLSCIHLQTSRTFYEEVLGLDVIQSSPSTMMIRKGSDHTYVVLETGQPSSMSLLDHNGIDVASPEAVDKAYDGLIGIKEQYGLKRVNRPKWQHGAYSFYFQDMDSNWWEILYGRNRGYAFTFEEGRDITGMTDAGIDINNPEEHVLYDEFAKRIGLA